MGPPRPGFNTFVNSFGPSSPVKSPRKKTSFPNFHPPAQNQTKGKGKDHQPPQQSQRTHALDEDMPPSSPTTDRVLRVATTKGSAAVKMAMLPPPWPGLSQEPVMEIDTSQTGEDYVALGEDQQEVLETDVEAEGAPLEIADQVRIHTRLSEVPII